ncbi:MAG: hypothetical protein ACRDK1_04900 [Solirubrobacterales bacterium]
MRRDVLVLCYHAVSARWTADLSARPDRLADHLGPLVKRGYRGTTFRDLLGPPTLRSR